MYFLNYLCPMASSSKTNDGAFRLSRTLGRVATIQRTFLKMALKKQLDLEPEWYYFLHTINTRDVIRKTDIISINLLFEPTTGIDILNRMIRAGLLLEKIDPADKRARLLSLTTKGIDVLHSAQQLAEQTAGIVFGNIPPALQKEMESHLIMIEERLGKQLKQTRGNEPN
jgi:DNA-binding MarR family transcriptional regulator